MRVEVVRTYVIEVPDTQYEDVVEMYLDEAADAGLTGDEIPNSADALAEDLALWMCYAHDVGDFTNFVRETDITTRVLP